MDIAEIMSALGGTQGVADAAQQAGVDPDHAQSAIAGILEHALQGGQAEGMVEAVSAKTGIPVDTINQFLPQVLPLIENAMGGASAGGGGGGLMGALGGLLGGGGTGGGVASLLGSLLGGAKT